VPAFHPTRKEVRAGVQTLTRNTRIRCETDPREHPFHCHHEKTVVVDGELAFVGGIDMTDYAGDRFDTSDHPARRRLGWHDVGTRLRGPAVADVDDHFALRWRELTGQPLDRPPAPAHAGEHTVQVVRTIANGTYDAVPDGEYRRRTTGRTTRSGSSGCWPWPTTGPDACSPPRSGPGPASASIVCTCTPRSGSSTTAG